MKNTATIVLIIAVCVIVYLLLPVADVDTNAKRDMSESEQDKKEVVSNDDATSIGNREASSQDHTKSIVSQKQQDATAKTYNTQQLEPEIKSAINELVNTSHEGLVEETTENGVGVDLKDRFRTAPVATINEKGEIFVQDYTSAPGR